MIKDSLNRMIRHPIKALLSMAYFHGYEQRCYPRWLRRRIARSQIHRAWLGGHMGIFTEILDNGEHKPCGVCDRQWYTRR